MRLRHQIVVVASDDADEKQCAFSREDATLTTVIEDVDATSSQDIELAASELNYSMAMGKVVTGRFLYIETDKELIVRLDGEVTGHKIGPPANGTRAKWCHRGTFSAAPIISNNTAEVARVAFLIAGMKT